MEAFQALLGDDFCFLLSPHIVARTPRKRPIMTPNHADKMEITVVFQCPRSGGVGVGVAIVEGGLALKVILHIVAGTGIGALDIVATGVAGGMGRSMAEAYLLALGGRDGVGPDVVIESMCIVVTPLYQAGFSPTHSTCPGAVPAPGGCPARLCGPGAAPLCCRRGARCSAGGL